MKKVLIFTLAALLVLATFCACDTAGSPVPSSSAPASSESSSSDSPSSDTSSSVSSKDDTPEIGALSDYVKTAKEATQSFSDGNTVTYRLPEILLDSSDAAAANKEIMDEYGDDCKTYDDYSPISKLDYEATLYDKYLSVIVTTNVDGGNSYGLCYCFDVTTGSKLNNETLCSMTGHDYNTAIETLTANVTAGYDESYSKLPGNDSEREKTLASDNISASKMYLDESGKLMSLVDIYAAVGGGHWANTFAAE